MGVKKGNCNNQKFIIRLGNWPLGFLFLQNLLQFQNHMREIMESVDSELLCCYVVLLHNLILELLLWNSPQIRTAALLVLWHLAIVYDFNFYS